jgi:hypothetical protein
MIIRIVAAISLLAASSAMAAPTKPKPASVLVITNAREVRATDVAIGANGQTARVAKPLAPNAKTTLRLPKMQGCLVAVAATFEDDSNVQIGEFDVCQDSTLRFTD